MIRGKIRHLLLIGLCGLVGIPWAAADLPVIEGDDKLVLQACAAYSRKMAKEMTEAHFQAIKCPEDLCWLDLPKINAALTSYQLTGDATLLREAGTALQAMLSTLSKGDDGLRGWYGAAIAPNLDPANPEARIREIQTDFRAVAVLSRFIELTDADPTLKAEYAAQRAGWIELMEKDLIGYWHDQGYYQDLGERGAIYQWNKAYRPTAAQLTLPHEKLSMMVDGLIGLYRITQNDEYARRAAKLGLWLKRTIALKDERYSWSRWSPAGPWDIHPENPAKWKTWVGADPKGQWYAAAVHTAALLHRHGLVFSRKDMERFTATQTQVCWNGDMAAPLFFQTTGKPADKGERFVAPPLAVFNPAFAEFVYGPAATAERVKMTTSDWKGGVMAAPWLLGKFVELPQGLKDNPADQALMASFLAKPENAALSAEKSFVVEPPGFTTPPAPPAPTKAP
jgi:hypothetical protein